MPSLPDTLTANNLPALAMHADAQPDIEAVVRPMVARILAFIQASPLGTAGASERAGGPDYEALYAVGHALYDQGRYREALQMFSYVTLHRRQEPRYLRATAAALQMLGQFDEAVAYYGIAAVLDADDPQPVWHSAECLLALGRRDEATEALEMVLEIAGSDPAHAQLCQRVRGMRELIRRGEPAGTAAREAR